MGTTQPASKHSCNQALLMEPAYKNNLWDNKKEGLYKTIVDGRIIFESKDKIDAGDGMLNFK